MVSFYCKVSCQVLRAPELGQSSKNWMGSRGSVLYSDVKYTAVLYPPLAWLIRAAYISRRVILHKTKWSNVCGNESEKLFVRQNS